MRCPPCRQENPPQAGLGMKCGTGTTRASPKCSTEGPAIAAFKTARDGEHAQVTAPFADFSDA